MVCAGVAGVAGGQEKTPCSGEGGGGYNLAVSYFRMTCRHTIIGATAFHFRVRNGNGWCHCAMTTRLLSTALGKECSVCLRVGVLAGNPGGFPDNCIQRSKTILRRIRQVCLIKFEMEQCKTNG